MIKTCEELNQARVQAQLEIQSYACRILVCSGTGCIATGSHKIHERFEDLVKETPGIELVFSPCGGHDGETVVGVKKTGCQGFCELGPLVRIQKGDKVIQYVKVQPGDCAEIVEKSVLGDEVIERLLYKKGEKVYVQPDEIPFIAKQTRIVLENCGKFDAESLDEYLASGGFDALKKAMFAMTRDEVIDEVDRSGLRGRGGGGFPTGRKWKQVARQKETVRYVVCNGDEGDPGAFMDGSVMEGDPFKLIEGMMIAAYAVRAENGYIYVRAEYPMSVARLRNAIAQLEERGLLGDKNTRVVAQIAPAVRVAIGEAFGLPKGENSMGKVVAALHRMGFDEVFDTAYTADLTIMEESAEFLERVKAGANLPLMTSCCPAWVKFVENEYPEFKENISTCRSPQAMFSAILKDYYRDEANAKGKKTVVVSVMPCTAKKMEAERKESYTHEEKDTDYVLTTTELIRMIDAHGINFEALPSESCDMPFGIGSGGGVIFGATGGVTEAVLRRLIEGHDPATLRAIAECGARGDEGIKEFSVPYNGLDVKICVASGLANARKVLESVKSGEKEYHFIEVMACPGGCVMGGGQPVYGTKVRRAETRTKGLYEADGGMAIKKSNENPLMDVFYNGYFKGKAHELLHNPHE